MGRGFFGVISLIGILIALGLILTHSTGFKTDIGAVQSFSTDVIAELESTGSSHVHH